MCQQRRDRQLSNIDGRMGLHRRIADEAFRMNLEGGIKCESPLSDDSADRSVDLLQPLQTVSGCSKWIGPHMAASSNTPSN